MERASYLSQKNPAAKSSWRRVKDEAVVCYWNDQRVVPRKIDGKMTYVVISGGLPSGEYDESGARMRHQELFPSLFSVDSRLQCHTVYRDNVVSSAASHSRADITGTESCECRGNQCGEGHGDRHDRAEIHPAGHDQACRFDVNDSNSVGGSSVTCLTQSWERHIFIPETPLTCGSGETSTSNGSTSRHRTSGIRKQSSPKLRRRQLMQSWERHIFIPETPLTCGSGETSTSNSSTSRHHTSGIREQSSPKLRRRQLSGERRLEASTDLVDSVDSSMDDCSSSNKSANLKFYLNSIKSQPNGEKIEIILRHWYGDYELLEYNHNYIQWLFPTKSSGVNSHAEPLTEYEAKMMRTIRSVRTRLVRAYKMMLDFYGLELSNVKNGRITRASNWKERFHHLNHSRHNYQRITRILVSIGMLGAAHQQAPLVSALIAEIFLHQTLPNAAWSCRSYWIPAVLDEKEKQKLFEAVKALEN